jgi:hypothetical protein
VIDITKDDSDELLMDGEYCIYFTLTLMKSIHFNYC